MPFVLISFGETRIDSGLATILNATVPLFNLIIAHFALSDERLTLYKIIGLGGGFLGVVILVSEGINSGNASIIGEIAILAASLSYASAVVTIRLHLRHVDPYSTAAGSLIIGAFVIIPITVLFAPRPTAIGTDALIAAITLAVINTVVAYFLFYGIIAEWGVRATLVTYAMPPIGVTLGVLVLDEVIGWQLIVGGLLILAGIIVTKSDNPFAFFQKLRLRFSTTP